VHWLNGLRRDAPDTHPTKIQSEPERSRLRRRIHVDSHWRSSEQFVPFVEIEGVGETWYGGIQWSGAWQIPPLGAGWAQLNGHGWVPEVKTSVSAMRRWSFHTASSASLQEPGQRQRQPAAVH